jgi:hypothetical protein
VADLAGALLQVLGAGSSNGSSSGSKETEAAQQFAALALAMTREPASRLLLLVQEPHLVGRLVSLLTHPLL